VFRKMAVVLFVLGLIVPAYSQQPNSNSSTPRPHHGMGMMSMRGMASDQQIDRAVDTLQSTLNLSPSQVTSIRQLARTRRESLSAIRDQAKPKFEQLMSLLEQTNPDPTAVGRIVVDLKAIHEQARTKQMDFEKQLSGILNPTQQQTVDNLRNQAKTFFALRRIGLLGTSEFPHGMFMSMKSRSGGAASDE
jgi:Spy/CpxP family protein refolding chaperone